ncbi:MAG: YhfC family glutamic-type intramembrane protease, partial [Dethiobacteria bacterium]|nr:YhfC family glutamic-type intramembrane protease [Dethiobacteria bacterium]
VFSLLLIFMVPLGLVIYFYRKEKIYLPAVLVGALVFLVFQLLTRIPLINYFSTMDWFAEMAQNIVFLIFFFALTAGIFEEIGRYLGFRFLLKKHLSWKNGVAFGIGHGGFEAIALVGTATINNLVTSIMINTGTFDTQVAPQLGEMANYLKQVLVETEPVMFFVAGVERMAALAIHIGLSVLVLYAVKKRKLFYLLAAIIIHGIINIPAVIYGPLNISIWLVEAYVIVFAVISIIFTKRSRPMVDNE